MAANFSLAASISALHAETKAFEAISNNIANATTPGHKEERINFRDFVVDDGRLSGNTVPALRGVGTEIRRNIRDEGEFLTSSNDLDIAISGRGFYVVTPALNDTSDILLTDAGTLGRSVVTNNGAEETYLVDGSGNFVQGWPFDATTETFTVGTDVSSLGPIRIDNASQAFGASATTTASVAANLPPDATTDQAFDIGITVFDGTGDADGVLDARTVTARFTKTANFNEWSLSFFGDNATVTNPTAAVTVQFDANGTITAPTAQTLDVTFANPAATNSIAVNFEEMRSFEPDFVLVETASNGFTEGTLSSTTTRSNGVIIGNFSNGQTRPIAKMALGDVINPELLTPVDSTHFRLNSLNGDLQLFEADVSGRATFLPNQIENSTVDLGLEVTKIIQTQRAYSSAATSLRTIEEMLETATRLKR